MSIENPWELKTPDDWWAAYTQIQDDVKGYMDPMSCETIAEHPLALARFGRSVVDTLKSFPADMNIHEMMDCLLAKRDRRLWDILNSIWVDAPDNSSIHRWPSWGKFCDLCSEGRWILFSELEGQQ